MSTMQAIPVSIQVLHQLRALGMDGQAEIPIAEVATKMGLQYRQVTSAISSLRQRGMLPRVGSRGLPVFLPPSQSNPRPDVAVLIHGLDEPGKVAGDPDRDRKDVARYVREWRVMTGRAKARPTVVDRRVPEPPPLGPVIARIQAESPDDKPKTWPRPPAPWVAGLQWKAKENRWCCEGKGDGPTGRIRFYTTLFAPDDWRGALNAYRAKLIEKIQSPADLAKCLARITLAVKEFEDAAHQPGGGDRAGTPDGGRGGGGEVQAGAGQAQG